MDLKPVWPGVIYAQHQIEGIDWMLQQESKGYAVPDKNYVVRGGILGDEMGLGKTIQALALAVNGRGEKTLIITPLAVRKQWETAALKAKLNVFTAEKNGWVGVNSRRVLGSKSVFLGHYDKVVADVALFQDMEFDRIILDEAHRIRNTQTVTGANVLKIGARYKWALTATPIVNKMDDAVAYLKFIGFRLDSLKWQDSYEQYISSTYLARKISECEAPAGLTLPPEPTVDTLNLDFTNEDERKLYDGILDNIETQWRSAQALNGRAYQLQKFAILLRLRQISVNPQIYIRARQKELFGWTGPTFNLPSRKFVEIAHLMRTAFDAGESHRWIIFCQFHEEMEMLNQFLKGFDYVGSVLQYHGGLSADERNKAIEESNKVSPGAKQDVFLVQLQAGGTGLNLQHYDRIIFVSPWWTSALLEQAKGRAVRIGQKNVVKIYWLKLMTEEDRMSIDDFMMNKASEKLDLAHKFHSLGVSLKSPPVC